MFSFAYRTLISYGPGSNTNKSVISEKREIIESQLEDKSTCPHCKSSSIVEESSDVIGKDILPATYCYKCGWRKNVIS